MPNKRIEFPQQIIAAIAEEFGTADDGKSRPWTHALHKCIRTHPKLRKHKLGNRRNRGQYDREEPGLAHRLTEVAASTGSSPTRTHANACIRLLQRLEIDTPAALRKLPANQYAPSRTFTRPAHAWLCKWSQKTFNERLIGDA